MPKLYTKKGDCCTTYLPCCGKSDKDCITLSVIGDIDELNSMIGLAISEVDFNEIKKQLLGVQKDLFKAGSEIARAQKKDITGKFQKITPAKTRALEKMIDAHCAKLPKLTNFILPGGCDGGACLHLARAICRRVERSLVSFGKTTKIRPELYKYFNRLSDYLFASARRENTELKEKEHGAK